MPCPFLSVPPIPPLSFASELQSIASIFFSNILLFLLLSSLSRTAAQEKLLYEQVGWKTSDIEFRILAVTPPGEKEEEANLSLLPLLCERGEDKDIGCGIVFPLSLQSGFR